MEKNALENAKINQYLNLKMKSREKRKKNMKNTSENCGMSSKHTNMQKWHYQRE
jgi:hypothetical protein